MNDLILRVRKLEERADQTQGGRIVLVWKDNTESEAEALSRRPDINPNDPLIELVFVQWLGEVEDATPRQQG
jgi:hypothetical protein